MYLQACVVLIAAATECTGPRFKLNDECIECPRGRFGNPIVEKVTCELQVDPNSFAKAFNTNDNNNNDNEDDDGTFQFDLNENSVIQATIQSTLANVNYCNDAYFKISCTSNIDRKSTRLNSSH